MHKLARAIVAFYVPWFSSRTMVYMLQNVEYKPKPFLRWVWRTADYSTVMKRRTLASTRAARFLRLMGTFCMILLYLIGLAVFVYGMQQSNIVAMVSGAVFVLITPFIGAHILAALLWVGQLLYIRRRERHQAENVHELLEQHPAKRIAIAGSYGKTSMKELLSTVLSEGLSVAATPGNMNVISSHLKFVQSLSGSEKVLLIEIGEGKPGDVATFTKIIEPNYAVITGIAPAHLDEYVTVDAAAEDIFSLTKDIQPDRTFVNGESSESEPHIPPGAVVYSRSGTQDWGVEQIQTDLTGTSFILKNGHRVLRLKSGLVGAHQVGPIVCAVLLAIELGLTDEQIEKGISRTKPYEHRMQPYQLSGAWVIDDTYNGNIEGIRAGTALLQGLQAKRRIYVTPGLVDQGDRVVEVHQEIGKLIADANPQIVVLMQNSVTQFIRDGLAKNGFSGEVRIEQYPLDFYTHLDHFVAAGDIVLMQNDWTDNYR